MSYNWTYFTRNKTHTMDTATLSVKGQIVIPKRLRQTAQVSFGDEFAISFSNGEIRLRPLHSKKQSALELVAGCMARPQRAMMGDAETKVAIKAKLKVKYSIENSGKLGS